VGTVGSLSGLWETAPIGGPEQGEYLNAVAVVRTPFGPRRLLDECLRIEHEHGRLRRDRWMPRTLDLDLLLYGDAVIDGPELRVPHPRMGERRFVLEPLAEVWPGDDIPGMGRIADLLDGVGDQQCVRLAGPDWAA
jgi:2-amino-4-hydroxy-6-hydroxymethyldihydropteridine diphosphokinase